MATLIPQELAKWMGGGAGSNLSKWCPTGKDIIIAPSFFYLSLRF
jgi:hypothetical protein